MLAFIQGHLKKHTIIIYKAIHQLLKKYVSIFASFAE